MTPARTWIAAGFALLGAFAADRASAVTEFRTLLDLDNSLATGCVVNTVDGPFAGVDQILITTVSTANPPVVTSLTRQICTGAVFGPPSAISSPFPPPWPVGLGGGVNGSAVIETYLPLSLAPHGNEVRLGFTSEIVSGGSGQDALLTTTGAPAAPPLVVLLASIVEVPTLGEWSLLLLSLGLAAAGWRTLRRSPLGPGGPLGPTAAGIGIALLLLGAGVAWAAIVPDGNPADWGAATPIGTDPATEPVNADIVAAFARVEGNVLFLRIDARLLPDSSPSATDDAATVSEDAPATTIDVLANDSDPDGDPFSVASVTQPANGTVVITNGGADLTYQPNPDYCNNPPGTTLDTFTYTLAPGGSTATVNVAVTCADDAPTAVADVAVVQEDAPATTLNVLANDTDPDAGPKSIVSVTQPANGTVVITNAGADLTYLPNPGYCNNPPGTVLDVFTYTLTPGGSSTTVDVTVSCVDDGAVAADDAATVAEDAPATRVNVLANDNDPDGDPFSIASVTQPANGTVVITNAGADLTYQPNPDSCNTPPGTTLDTFTYTLTPGGSTATVAITVTCADDDPIAVDDAATVAEEAPATAIDVLANDSDPEGDPFTIASVTQPANGTVVITGGGTGLTYQPNANFCNNPPGTTPDTFTYTLTPGGSTATVSLLVTCQNDPPVADADSFDFIGNTELRVDTGAAAAPHVLETTPSTFGVLDGDSDPVENDPLSVAGIVGCADVTAPFVCALAGVGTVTMEANGRFSFVPEPGDTGAAEAFQYTLSDGQDTAVGTVTLNRFERVWYVKNDAPAGGLGRSTDPFDTLVEAQTASLDDDYVFVYFGSGIMTGQTEGFALKDGQHLIGEHVGLSLPVDLNGNGAPTVLVPAVPGNRPVINDEVVDSIEGISALDVVPAEIAGLNLAGIANAIDWNTTAAFAGGGTFAIHDNQILLANNEGVDINLAGSGAVNLAFHDNSLTATGRALDILENGTGTLTITAFDDNVVTGNSASAGLMVNGAVFDAVPGGGSDPVAGGTTLVGVSGNGVGGAGVVLTGVTGSLAFADLDIFADGGAGLQATSPGGFALSVAPAVGVIEATGGPAVNINTAAVDLQLVSLRSTNSPSTGVLLDTITGTFSAGSASSIANPAGFAFRLLTSIASVSYAGTINGTGNGVQLSGNAGSTIAFTGNLTLSTGANAAFSATGGGTVTSTGTASTLATTTGTALNVVNTTIGAAGLTFRGVSSNGAASGIVLTNTGAAGGLTVTGTGAAGTGGTIQASTNAGIRLTNTSNVSLARMVVQNGLDDGIRGSNVTGFTLSGSTVSGNGDAAAEHGIEFSELLGTAGITGSTVTGSAENNLRVDNGSGTLPLLTVGGAGCAFSNNSATLGGDGLFFRGTGSAAMAIAVSGCSFSNHRLQHFNANTNTTSAAVMDVNFTGNTLTGAAGNTNAGVALTPSGSAQMTFDLLSNDIQGAVTSAIDVTLGAASTATGLLAGTIAGNTIGTAAVPNSGSSAGDGITVTQNGAGTLTTLISGNTIRQYNGVNGIGLVARATGVLNATVTGNTIANPGAAATNAVLLNAGPVATDTSQVCLVLGGPGGLANSFLGAGANGNTDFRVRQRAVTTVTLPGYGGGNTATAAVVTFIRGNNTGSPSGTANVNSPPGGGFVNGPACPLP